VIRDDTDRLLEEDPARKCQAGDRLVVVGRHPALDRLVSRLTG
jgi:K+/H+ antiporter YhaU regulatory subunit KhtT